ncbi:hypothetical protein ANCCAN_05523 [Ancylostoma caninum]|uniref:Uncharacterized protein n=1 Tax=Ancylostoma caninum TaxID=29170 RepID=A0A368GZC8_ANCCA|nr:hypothetical protein ANCCAN_05523 [Ancylostoma caninum]
MERNEERLAEAEAALKQARANLAKELEHKKKAEQLRAAESSKLKEETAKTEQLTAQLKKARNDLEKLEKKKKQNETRIGTLEAAKFHLEDKVKNLQKELDLVKKKAAEDRSKAEKEKKRDAEHKHRLNSEALERETERDRERLQYERFRRDAKNREEKWEKERKQRMTQIVALLERARLAEDAQAEMMMTADALEKTHDEAAIILTEAEGNSKRSRTHSNVEMIRRIVAGWKCAHDGCVSAISQARSDLDAACDAIRKGQKTPAQLTDLKIPSTSVSPKIARLPPVEVMQPSMPACPTAITSVSRVIQAPPAGVIGQPRTLQNNRYSSLVLPRGNAPESPSNTHVPQSLSFSSLSVSGNLSTAPPPTTQLFERSSMKQPLPIGARPGLVPTPATLPMEDTAVPSTAAPAASPWSWATPFGNLADILPLRYASEHTQPLLQQTTHHEILRNGASSDLSQIRAPPGFSLGWGRVNGSSTSSQSQSLNQNSSVWRGTTGNAAAPPGQQQDECSAVDKYPMQFFYN